MIDNLDQLSILLYEDFGIEVDLHLETRCGKKPYLKSSEIHFADLGIFGYALKNCVLDSFNSIYLIEGGYILHLHLSYEHIDGGRNSCSLGRSYLYDPELKRWERWERSLITNK